MLDIYTVLIMAGALQLGILAESVLREGIYIFGGGLLLSMVAITLARGVAGEESAPPKLTPPEYPVMHLPVVAAATVGLFLMGISRPLLRAEKWIFWKNQYSLLGAASGMMNGGMVVLGVGFVLFVLVLPLVQQLLVLALGLFQWFEGPAPKVGRLLLKVERWAMMDVVALALIVVLIRLGNVANVELPAGTWFLGAAVLLTLYGSFRVRRFYEVD
jgi:paraquat-inducible protein A